jgi:hypothetical protein
LPAARGEANPRPHAGTAAGPNRAFRVGDGQIQAGSPEQLEPADAATDRINREASGAELLDVAQDGALRHFQLGGELRSSHPAPRLKEAQELDKPPGTHDPRLAGIMTLDVMDGLS